MVTISRGFWLGEVPIDAYARLILRQRAREGHVTIGRLRYDVRELDGTQYRGRIDVVSGGFPCQAFSTASRGRRRARDLWQEMLRIVLECESRHVFAENVHRRPIETATRDLARVGYVVCYARVSAAVLGAPHRYALRWF